MTDIGQDDVDRALAAVGAKPFAYHNFRNQTVRAPIATGTGQPPRSDPAVAADADRMAGAGDEVDYDLGGPAVAYSPAPATVMAPDVVAGAPPWVPVTPPGPVLAAWPVDRRSLDEDPVRSIVVNAAAPAVVAPHYEDERARTVPVDIVSMHEYVPPIAQVAALDRTGGYVPSFSAVVPPVGAAAMAPPLPAAPPAPAPPAPPAPAPLPPAASMPAAPPPAPRQPAAPPAAPAPVVQAAAARPVAGHRASLESAPTAPAPAVVRTFEAAAPVFAAAALPPPPPPPRPLVSEFPAGSSVIGSSAIGWSRTPPADRATDRPTEAGNTDRQSVAEMFKLLASRAEPPRRQDTWRRVVSSAPTGPEAQALPSRSPSPYSEPTRSEPTRSEPSRSGPPAFGFGLATHITNRVGSTEPLSTARHDFAFSSAHPAPADDRVETTSEPHGATSSTQPASILRDMPRAEQSLFRRL